MAASPAAPPALEPQARWRPATCKIWQICVVRTGDVRKAQIKRQQREKLKPPAPSKRDSQDFDRLKVLAFDGVFVLADKTIFCGNADRLQVHIFGRVLNEALSEDLFDELRKRIACLNDLVGVKRPRGGVVRLRRVEKHGVRHNTAARPRGPEALHATHTRPGSILAILQKYVVSNVDAQWLCRGSLYHKFLLGCAVAFQDALRQQSLNSCAVILLLRLGALFVHVLRQE